MFYFALVYIVHRMSRVIILISFFFLETQLFGETTLFINNNAVVYLRGVASAGIPLLYVNGDLSNYDGNLTNDSSILEITGNWTNSAISNGYTSTGTERFSGNTNQQLSGTWDGTILNKNQLSNVEIEKNSVSGQYLSLLQNVHVNSNGSLKFTGNYGIIRTDINSHGSNGNAYPYYLYLQNPDATKFIGYSWTNVSNWGNNGGATTKYVEGKLKRNVANTQQYQFPVGVSNTSLDGMEGVTVAFNSSFSKTGLLAYIQPAAIPSYENDLITDGNKLFYDVGGMPISGISNQFTDCNSGPDGTNDLAVIDNAISHEWILYADAPTAPYNITVHPGSALDNLTYVQMGSACNSIFPKAKYLAKNGRIGGDGAVGPTNDVAFPGVSGLYQQPTGNTLSSQNTWSRFRLFGVVNANNTVLPVELTSFTATPVNNTYIRLDWITASENNNKGFVIQRSTDGSMFDSIGWVDGNGTTASIHNYSFNDVNVQRETLYYYRLKQVDNSGQYHYSYVVAAKITLTSGLSDNNISAQIKVFPNPFVTETILQISPYKTGQYYITVIDEQGKTMLQQSQKLWANEQYEVPVNSKEWASGMYILKIITDTDGTSFYKIIKQN